jgi:hypothetical protein
MGAIRVLRNALSSLLKILHMYLACFVAKKAMNKFGAKLF